MTRPPAPGTTPKPGEIIAERYRVERVVVAEPPRRRFIATEREGTQRVEIVELPNHSAVLWASAMTIEHPTLPTLFATLSRYGASYGIFEQVAGKSLDEQLAAGERFDALAACRASLALLDAVARLRRAGVVHGAIDGNAVVFSGPEPQSVRLCYRGQLPDGSPFRPPERAAAEPPEPADDLWALSGVLFQLLTGRPPPVGGVYAEEDLRAQGMGDPVLRGIVAQGLAGDPGRRSERLGSLQHPLSRFVSAREVGDDPNAMLGGRRSRPSGVRSLRPQPKDDPDAPSIEVRAMPSSEPPQSEAAPSIEVSASSAAVPSIEIGEPSERWPADEAAISTSAPPPVAPSSVEPSGKPGRGTWIGVGVVGVAAIAALAVLGTRRPPAHPAGAAAPPPPVAPPAATPSAELPEAPPAPKPALPAVVHRTPTETTASCVVRHLPNGSFASVPDMEFVCTTHDPRKGAHLIRAALVTASNGLTVTPAMRSWSGLTWYGMAAYAALRAACCPDAPAIELPEPAKNCAAIGPVLDEIGKAAVSGASVDEPLTRFHTAIGCELDNRRAAAFWQKGRPGGAEPTTLRGLLESVEKPRPPE